MSIEKPSNPAEKVGAENTESISNPNSIGELISMGSELPTSADKVYRGVSGKEAIDDLFASGVVRNKQSAGIVENSRWGEKVFWSRGAAGKFHPIQVDRYIIEAPHAVASERQVRSGDVTAIYTKNTEGAIEDLLKTRGAQESEELNEVRARLNLPKAEET